jgi:hypothetical protein
MGALLIEATEHLEREAFFAKARNQLQELRRADPAGWEADRLDSQQWQESTGRDTLTSQDEPGWWE